MDFKKEYRIKLVSKEFLNSDTCYLGFECPDIANTAVPGQFVNISAGTVFLKRPFGIASTDKEKGELPLCIACNGSTFWKTPLLKESTEAQLKTLLQQPFEIIQIDDDITKGSFAAAFIN